MAFIKFPILFTEDQADFKEYLGLDPEKDEGIISVNTNAMCGYNENDNGNVMMRMANGDCWELPMNINDFEDILQKSEAIISLSLIRNN